MGDIVRAVRDVYLKVRRTTPFQRKALWAIERCRTAVMKAVRVKCEECGDEYLLYRSCRNRHCPRCQVAVRERWLAARERELLSVPYFHVVFTVPEILNEIALYCPEVFYGALLSAAGNALLDVGMSKLRARLGVLTILHTWGQNLMLHPHAHCVVPGGGFSQDRKRWIGVRKPTYLLPVKVLMARFRTLLCNALRQAAKEGKLHRLPKNALPYAAIEGAAAQEWIVYAKPPFGGPRQVLEYLSRYTHRVAISNRRILSFANGKVTFVWRDYADGNRVKVTTVDVMEFMRRFLMHVLPDRFVRIRYYGFLANGRRHENIDLARELIGRSEPLRFRQRRRFRALCPACMAKSMRAHRHRGAQQRNPYRPPPVRADAVGVVL